MAITAGGSLNSVAAPIQQTLASNYIDFTGGTADWNQQYLPDLMEKEAEVFGKRTVSGFLAQVGAEEPMASDQVVWSEQGRLHLSYLVTTGSTGTTVTVTKDADGNTPGTDVYTTKDHGIRLGDMLLLADADKTLTAWVSGVNSTTGVVTVKTYASTQMVSGGIADGASVNCLVIGSEYIKGTTGRANTNMPKFQSFDNKPIIIKDKYDISGSDASAIGWVEVSGEDGQTGYLWYLKAEGDTRSRFADYLEMAMIESDKATGSQLNSQTIGGQTGNVTGTEGLFAAVESRGNMSSGVTGVNAATDLAEFDAILAEFDKQGSIEENMLFVNRATALAMDDMLASMNSYGAGGTSYGVFSNSESMALNLGFSGFRRGSYDFYKSDWKYLNDRATRGLINDRNTSGAIRGVFVPAGVSTVYDQNLGKNLKRPFLHVRYRASNTESRKFKSWITGSVGAVTSDLDAMEVHYLSERCLVTQGANNFMLLN
jgi:hypothetical protein